MRESELKLLKEKVLLLDYPKSRIFSLSGPDHLRYLHNRLTQDLKSLKVGESVEAMVLTPNGRVQGEFLVLKREQDLLLITDEIEDDGQVQDLKAALLQFKVADQLELKDLSADFARLALVGDPVHLQAEKLGFISPASAGLSVEEREILGFKVITCRSEGPFTRRIEIFAPTFAVLPLKMGAAVSGIAAATPGLKESLRVVSGKARFTIDIIPEKTMAPECDISGSISFKKGCYPGQEVVEMSTARGRPNRKFVQLLLPGDCKVGHEIRVGDRSIGALTSAFYLENAELTVGLAFLKSDALESAQFDNARLTSPAEVRKLFFE